MFQIGELGQSSVDCCGQLGQSSVHSCGQLGQSSVACCGQLVESSVHSGSMATGLSCLDECSVTM